MARAEEQDRVGAVVLAAGEAQRFGAPKLLMAFGESTVLGCVVSALREAAISPIIVVAGGHGEEVAQTLLGSGARVLSNPVPERGMVSSIRVGMEALPADLDRFLIALGDQPRVSAEAIRHLLRAHRASRKGVAIPVYRGKRGHPAVFAGCYRAEILALGDDQTLRDVIHAHGDDLVEVECASDAVIHDIDTRDEYEEQLRRQSGNA
jgi:molybdenum cofactor cytidylyltransferase